jgi:hypothetical protein
MAVPRLAAGSIAVFVAVAISPALVHSTEVAAETVHHRVDPSTSTSTEPTTTSTEPTTTSTEPTTTTSTEPTPTSTQPSPVLTRPRRRSTRPARRSRQSPSARPQQAEAIADSSGWDWRRAGVVILARFHPEECCHWGVYDPRSKSLWIGPSAFANPSRLRYTVLHELGHAWQWRSGRLDRLSADMAPWRRRGMAALEAGADCISVVWGASPRSGHYWACPPAAARLVARRLAGDWSS